MKDALVMMSALARGGAFLKHFAHGIVVAMGMLSLTVLFATAVTPDTPLQVVPRVVIPEAHAESVVPVARVEVAAVEESVEPEALAETPVRAEPPALSPEMERVRRYVARRYRVSQTALLHPLARAEQSAEELGLDPLLIVAVMAIESSFNPMAESTVGAQGLMQVIPRFHMDKIGPDATPESLFDPVTNVRVGSLVIREGLRRYGSMVSALQYYGGALKDEQTRYARKVLSMQARLAKVADPSDA